MRNSTSTKNTSAATRTTRTRTAPTKAPRVECLCPDCNGLVTLVRRAGRIEVLPHAVHRRIAGKVKDTGITLVPLSLYFKDGFAKVELAVARGRKSHDKRQAIAEREAKREAQRAIGRRDKGIE